LGAALWLATLLAAGRSSAETLTYEFEIPDRQEAHFEVSFEARAPGRLVVEASWDGSRILSFRLEGPGEPPSRWLRAGPSPQRFQASVSESAAASGRAWTMTIRALPARGTVTATLTVQTPEVAAAPPPSPPEPAAPEPEPSEPWARPQAAPASSSPRTRAVYESVEAFRAAAISDSGDPRPDACSWRAAFLRFAAAARDAGTSLPSPPEGGRAPCAPRLAAAVRQVEALRASGDPDLSGPPPGDPMLRISWKARRGERIRPLEEELDRILEAVRGGRCADLAGEEWPSRFTACLTACQRHFDERAMLGGEAAANAEMTREQWPAFLAAAAVLEALAAEPAPQP
jgi:hypothetical protein